VTSEGFPDVQRRPARC